MSLRRILRRASGILILGISMQNASVLLQGGLRAQTAPKAGDGGGASAQEERKIAANAIRPAAERSQIAYTSLKSELPTRVSTCALATYFLRQQTIWTQVQNFAHTPSPPRPQGATIYPHHHVRKELRVGWLIRLYGNYQDVTLIVQLGSHRHPSARTPTPPSRIPTAFEPPATNRPQLLFSSIQFSPSAPCQ